MSTPNPIPTRKVVFQLPNTAIAADLPYSNMAMAPSSDEILTPEEVAWINELAYDPRSLPTPQTTCLRIQTKSFLELPGEVRNKIYRYAFVHIDQKPVNGITTKFPAIGLLATNKQVHQEASSILYGENSFTFGLEIDWRGRPEIQLHGFPHSLPIWPTPCYHFLLKRLRIGISFTAGLPTDLEAPEIMRKQIQSMRDAYDIIWDDLDIFFRFKKGNLEELTFTMAWIKFRMLEPIAHSNCRIKTSSKVCPLVKWALEATLMQKDLRSLLSTEQLQALSDSEGIANDVYEANKYQSIYEVATRLAYGSVRAPVVVQNGLFHNHFPHAPPMPQPHIFAPSLPHTQFQAQSNNALNNSLFSNVPAQPPALNPFSNLNAQQPTSNFFSNPPTISQQTSNLFSSLSAPLPAPNLFSNSSAPPPGTNIFGNSTTAQPTSSFFSNLPPLPAVINLVSSGPTQPPTSNVSSNGPAQPPGFNIFNNGLAQSTSNLSSNVPTQASNYGPVQLPATNIFSHLSAPPPASNIFNFSPAPPPTTNPVNPTTGPAPSNNFTFAAPPSFAHLFTNPPPQIQNILNNLPPIPQPRYRRYKSWEFRDDLRRTLTEAQATQLLMKDNEMRICAALDLPAEAKDLCVKKCAVLRSYFALMETAGKITALTRCLEEAELEKIGDVGGWKKGKGKEKMR